MTKTCLIGLDLGTTMLKGVLMDSSGEILFKASKAAEYIRRDNGIVEFDADDYYIKVTALIRNLVAKLPPKAFVAGISMVSAGGNTILLDKDGKPLAPAISWLDNRDEGEINQLFSRHKDNIHEIIGWPYLETFPLSHLSWLKIHKPEILDSAHRICMSTDYINFRLTGRWGIDTSTATTFYLQKQKSAKWHVPFLDILSIPQEKLPPIYDSGTVLGNVTPEAAKETGLPQGTPVVLGAFDHPCAARGTGVFEEGQMLLSCGTSWVGFYPVADRKKAVELGMLVDPFLQPDGLWGAMFSLPAVSGRIDEYIRCYISDKDDRYIQFDILADAAQPGSGGLKINPMKKIEPIQIAGHTKENIARALMEGTAYPLKEKVDSLAKEGIACRSAVMVGGPSEAHPWSQIVCDILGIPITIINGSCAGAAGAALLAGTGAGIYTDIKDAFKSSAFDKMILKPAK